MFWTSIISQKKRHTTDLLSHQYVTGSLKNKTSVHDANEAHMHHLDVLADASDEAIQEALNELLKKTVRAHSRSKEIDFGDNIVKHSKSENILDQFSPGPAGSSEILDISQAVQDEDQKVRFFASINKVDD